MLASTVTFGTNAVWWLQEQSFWEMVSFSSQKMLLNLGVMASIIPFKLAPSIFPRKLLAAAVPSMAAGSLLFRGIARACLMRGAVRSRFASLSSPCYICAVALSDPLQPPAALQKQDGTISLFRKAPVNLH